MTNNGGWQIGRYACGCIGLSLPARSNTTLIFKVCDADGNSDAHTLEWRDMSGKSFEALHELETEKVLRSIRALIGDGQVARDVVSLLDAVRARRRA